MGGSFRIQSYETCVHVCLVASAVSDSLWPYGWQPNRLLCPWDSPGKNTDWSGLPCLPRGDLPDLGFQPTSSRLLYFKQILYWWASWETQLVGKRREMEEGKLNGSVEIKLSISLETCPSIGIAGSSSHSSQRIWVYSGEIGNAYTSAIRSDWQETPGILKCMKVKQTLYLRKRQLGEKKPNK